MKLFYTVSLFLLSYSSVLSQKEATHWYFGYNDGFTFKKGFPEESHDGFINTLEGCATISDSRTGDLLLYTDGVTVWNNKHEVIKNGYGLKGHASSTQSALIVPFSLQKRKFYVFTVPSVEAWNENNTYLTYSVVSLEKSGGELVEQKKNIPLLNNVSEKLTGTINCENGGHWVLAHHKENAVFYAMRVFDDGVTSPVISSFGSLYKTAHYGTMKISPGGKKIATFFWKNLTTKGLYLFDFDNNTGYVKNIKEIAEGNANFTCFYGVSFSSDNTKLYTSSEEGILQFDLTSNNEKTIRNSKVVISRGIFNSFQLGPDQKLHITGVDTGTGRKWISVIHQPNNKGTNCQLEKNVFEIHSPYSLPNFMDYIFDKDYVGLCVESLGNIDTVNVCVGAVFTLTHRNSRGASQRKWEIENGEIISQSDSTVQVIIKQKGEYKVTLTYRVKGQTDILHSIVHVLYDSPKADAGENRTPCLTQDALSTRLGSDSVAGNTYSWSPTTGLDNPFSSYPIATLAESRQYILTVTNKEGCVNYDTVLISIVKNDVKTNGDVSICKGQSVQLSATGSISYKWEPTSSLLYPNSDRPIATPSITTTYKVIGDNGICKDSAFVTVSVDDYPVATAGDDQKTCPRIPVSLGSPPIDGLEYSWSPPLYLNNPNSSQPECTPLDNVRYILSVRNKTGCTSYDTVDIITGGALPLSVSEDKNLCLGDQVQLSAQGADSYLWTPHDGLQDTTSPNPIASPSQTTMYYVTGFKGDCFAKDSVLVTVFPKPNVRVVPADTVICAGEGVLLTAFGADSYRWSPATGLESPNEHQTIAKPAVTTEYVVEGSTNGCTSFQKTTVHVLNNESVAILPTIRTDQHFRHGDIVPFPFTIPSRLSQVRFTITFDTCCIVFHSLNSDNVSATISQHNDSSVTITVLNPERQNGMVNVQFMPLLPPDKRLQEKFSVIVNEFTSVCAHVYGGETEIFYDPGCAWNLRGIQTTDKFSILPITNNRAVLHTGIGGLITVSIYDMTGNEVWRMKDTYPSSTEEDIILPELASGVFILRAQNYGWKSDVILVK